jgi:hypothetical protein
MRDYFMNNFDTAVTTLLERIGNDYDRWSQRTEYHDETRVEKFRDELTLKPGRKYLKITNDEVRDNGNVGSRVWGFVVLEDDKKFKKGDILMAAGYNAPARNHARGNIFEDYSIQWTGPNYLF